MPLDEPPTSDGEPTTGRDSEESFRAARPAIPPPPVREPADTWPFPAHASPAGWAVPPGYEFVGELGRGGMGIVYEARQLRPGRTVALKVLRPDRAGPGDAARLQAEAEAAARLQHPNIVQLYEVGEHGGSLYLCLEYVAGGSLAARLAEAPLTAAEAARLVETLAQAVAHAHSRGVVHRDLKPGNVLLADAPKITDFGLAKRLDGGGDQTLSGAVLGTPSYLAPEQAAGRAKDAGPAVDIYALGAVLYECLTGRPPFRAATPLATLDQVRTLDPVPPRTLQPVVPRDLEVVCLKCLEKEPGRRYASASALADDIARFRRGEPTRARPVGPAGRLMKWVRRQPRVAALLAVSTLAVAALIVGGVVANVLLRAAAARAEARHRLSLEAIDRFLTRVGQDRLTNVPEMEGVRRELLDEALGFYRRLLAESDGRDPALRLEAGLAATRVGDIQRMLGRHDDAAASQREAIALLEPLAAGDPVARRRLAGAYLRAGLSDADRARTADAEAHYRTAEALLRPLAADRPDEETLADLAATAASLAVVYQNSGRMEPAETAAREALALRRRVADAFGDNRARRVELAMSHHNLCHLLMATGRNTLAVEQGESARRLLEALYTETPRDLSVRGVLGACCNNLAFAYFETGRPTEAEACHRRALELRTALVRDYPLALPMRSALAESHNGLGDLLFQAGRLADAEPHFREAVKLREAVPDPSPHVRAAIAESRGNLALIVQQLGRKADAAAEYAAAHVVLEKLVADYPDQTRHATSLAQGYVNQATLARETGRPDDALVLCGKALALSSPILARVPNHAAARAAALNAHGNAAQTLESQGRFADAVPHWDRVVELNASPNRVVMVFLRAAALAKAGDHRRAVADIVSIADEPRWGPAECYDLARVVAVALGAVDADSRLASPERTAVAADYAGRTAALLKRARPADRAARWTFVLKWFTDAEFRAFFRRPECQSVVAGLELFGKQ